MADTVVLEASFPDEPALDLAVSSALLQAVSAGDHPPAVRVYRPGRAVAFSRRDARRAGFARACDIAQGAGYDAVLRGPGGSAAALGPATVVIDQIVPTDEIARGTLQRFEDAAGRIAAALRGLDLDARVGRVPREYCPGDHSINLAGRVKVAGVAQRIVRRAALVSTVVVVGDGAEVRRVIGDVYRELGLDHDPCATGSIQDVAPGLSTDDVARHVTAALVPGGTARPLDDAILRVADELRARHVAVPKDRSATPVPRRRSTPVQRCLSQRRPGSG